LSQARQTVLIKATVSVILFYAMSTFFLPDSLHSLLDCHFKEFWWGFPKGKTKNLSLKSWRSICMPQSQGGLGIRDMKSTNLAPMTKLGWTFINHAHKAWVQHLHKKYIPMGLFVRLLLPFLLLGCGRVSKNVNFCFLRVHVSKYLFLHIFLFGPLLGFLPCLLLFPSHYFQIIGICQWALFRTLSRHARINGI
jgi:hypothetical protein